MVISIIAEMIAHHYKTPEMSSDTDNFTVDEESCSCSFKVEWPLCPMEERSHLESRGRVSESILKYFD